MNVIKTFFAMSLVLFTYYQAECMQITPFEKYLPAQDAQEKLRDNLWLAKRTTSQLVRDFNISVEQVAQLLIEGQPHNERQMQLLERITKIRQQLSEAREREAESAIKLWQSGRELKHLMLTKMMPELIEHVAQKPFLIGLLAISLGFTATSIVDKDW